MNTATSTQTRPRPTPVGPFASQHEADSYRFLHDHGLEAYDARWGMAGNSTLNRWHDTKLCRIVHTPEGVTVRTFAKYAKHGQAPAPETNEAETIARATGSVGATVTHEHRDPKTGQLVTDSVQTWER